MIKEAEILEAAEKLRAWCGGRLCKTCIFTSGLTGIKYGCLLKMMPNTWEFPKPKLILRYKHWVKWGNGSTGIIETNATGKEFYEINKACVSIVKTETYEVEL